LSWIKPRLVGITNAHDVQLSSRVFLAEEAHAMGFLNQVLSAEALMDHVYDYARTMAASVSPGSLRETKRQLYSDQHRSLAEAVQDSERLLLEMTRQPDCQEGVKAWQEGRAPKWEKD
jgi:enoyl-CoA hydratase/carnithine racemase